jgi:TolA-binding protein
MNISRLVKGRPAVRRLLIVAVLMSGISAAPAIGQSTVINLRVDKLEKEMKAVQRKVFPGGAGLEPEIDPATVSKPVGTPSSAPINDLTARVDALETQLRTMTGQVEQGEFRLRKLEDGMKAHEARLKALETANAPAEIEAGTVAAPPIEKPKPVVEKPKPPAVAKPATDPKPTVADKADPARKAAVAAIEIPDTGDASEDTYTYGFRLYSAKMYPEAQAKLKEYIAKYPNGKKASHARNLLGRAYLDEGKPALASVAFYDNYQKLPRGERAADSLSWLGSALIRLKKPADACKVYTEFNEVYGAKAAADAKARVTKGRADAKCTT